MTDAVIIEDDPLASMTLAHLLEGEGFSVRCFHNTDDARQSCLDLPPDILITDWCVPGTVSPRQLVRLLKSVSAHTRVVFISGYSPEDLQEGLAELQGVECFVKPLNYDRFLGDVKAGAPSQVSSHH